MKRLNVVLYCFLLQPLMCMGADSSPQQPSFASASDSDSEYAPSKGKPPKRKPAKPYVSHEEIQHETTQEEIPTSRQEVRKERNRKSAQKYRAKQAALMQQLATTHSEQIAALEQRAAQAESKVNAAEQALEQYKKQQQKTQNILKRVFDMLTSHDIRLGNIDSVRHVALPALTITQENSQENVALKPGRDNAQVDQDFFRCLNPDDQKT
jgi:hypothetical protein